MTEQESAGPTSRVYFSQRLRLHYVDWGNGGKPPLILLHGGQDHCRNWDWVAEELRADYHIIAPDLRGHGDSAWSPSGDQALSPWPRKSIASTWKSDRSRSATQSQLRQ